MARPQVVAIHSIDYSGGLNATVFGEIEQGISEVEAASSKSATRITVTGELEFSPDGKCLRQEWSTQVGGTFPARDTAGWKRREPLVPACADGDPIGRIKRELPLSESRQVATKDRPASAMSAVVLPRQR